MIDQYGNLITCTINLCLLRVELISLQLIEIPRSGVSTTLQSLIRFLQDYSREKRYQVPWLEFNENQSEFTCVISANRLLMLEAFEGLSLPFIPPSDEFSSKLHLSINVLYDCWE